MNRSGLVPLQSETVNLHTHEAVASGRYAPAIDLQWQTYPQGHDENRSAYLRRLRRAFVAQRLLFERHVHQAPTLLVWPFSTCNALAVAEAKAAGYQAAFASTPAW